MDSRGLNKLIRFHETGLAQYRQFISPAAQYLERQTILILKQKLNELSRGTSSATN